MSDFVRNYIKDTVEIRRNILENEKILTQIEDVSSVIVNALKSGNKILLCGNGGSAADAQHIAAEFVGRFKVERNPLPAIALSTDTSLITAVGNDYGFEFIFSRQVQALGSAGDVLVGISTSGASENVVNAMMEAMKKNIHTIGFTGAKISMISDIADITLKVPTFETSKIQEAHIMFGHIICAIVERRLFGAF